MKKITTTICALLFTAITAPAEEDPETKPWREIATGSQSNIEGPTREAIQTPEQWQAWWAKHNNTEITADDGTTIPEPAPAVDFDKETVLVATLGTRSTGGFSIRFTGIRKEGDAITATLKITSPGSDDMVTMALTAPFTIIAIPKHIGTIDFADEAGK